MRTKFHGTSGRIASICHSFGDSRGGHRNRDESTMGRDHERVNRFIALLPLITMLYAMRDKTKARFIFTLKKLN